MTIRTDIPLAEHAEPILRLPALRALEAANAGLPLMERAGAATAAWAQELCTRGERPLLIVAGPGNNGGDAFVVARLLHERFFSVHVVFAGDAALLPPDAKHAHARLVQAGVAVHDEIPQRTWGMVIDGLFGVGLKRPLAGRFATLVAQMQAAAGQSACPLLAIDCPSGLDCDSGLGHPSGPSFDETQAGEVLACVSATHTITFLALKPGLLTGDGPERCGKLRVATLGVTLKAAEDSNKPSSTTTSRKAGQNFGAANGIGCTIARDNIAACLQARPGNSHKGSFGAAGILGGAAGMLGAAVLAARAAVYLGAGRVYLSPLDPQAPPLDAQQPELMLRQGETLFAAPLTALAVGPGMGVAEEAERRFERAIAGNWPLVVDADALNLLAQSDELKAQLAARGAPSVLTPHPAEAARLLGTTTSAVQADRIAAAATLAASLHAWVVLKGQGSIIASPEGEWWINTTGNPGLATAGSGDVLSGMIVALLAQGLPTADAVRAAVHLHGAAADRLAKIVGGCVGLTASELAPSARRVLNRWIACSARN